jgi:YVTN family beta-propeller protein
VIANLNNTQLYVTNTQDDSVSVIDMATHKTIATIEVGMTPEGLSLDALNSRLYVANWGTNDVSVIDTVGLKVIATIKTGDKSRAFGQFILP